jgi:Fe-S cluster assembly iron-binding protein IscA
MSEQIRVFVNGSGVSVAAGSTVLDAVSAIDAAAADEVRGGTRVIVDSRGLPVSNDTAVHGGYVMRIVSARQARATED